MPDRLLGDARAARLAFALAWAGGMVDATGFLTLAHLFTAHMSGNSAALGAYIGIGDWAEALRRLTPIPLSVVGVGIGAALIEAATRLGVRSSLSVALAVESLLLLGFRIFGGSGLHPGAPSASAAWQFDLLTAFRAPVLAITGMPYHDLIGTDYVQDLNTDYLFQDVALVSQRVMGPSHVTNLADKAIRAALSHRGVGHLAIPIDTQVAEAGADKRSKRNIKGHTSESYQAPFRVPVRSELEKAAQVFAGKHKIAILVGAGARGSGDEVEQAAEKLGAPVIKALLGKDVIPDDSPYTTRGAGLVGTRPSHMALKACDALLIVGSSFPYIEFYPKPGQAAGVQIDMDPERIGLRYSVDVGLVGDARATLHELLPLLPRNDDRTFLQQAQHAMQEWWELMEERSTRQTEPMRPQTVPWFLGEVLRDDAIVCGDSGTVTNWIARQLRLRRGQNFSFSGTLRSMACGMSYALGAQVAYPDRQVVAVVGDGGFTMLPSAFISAVQAHLPIKVVVLKNNVLGLIKWEQMVYLGNPQYGVEMAPFDFVKFAEAAGGRGVRITDPARCREQLAGALGMDGPVVVEAVVDANEPPMPTNVKPVQAAHLAEALVRGEPNRQRIGLTLFRDVVDETTFAAARSGVVARVMEKAAKVAGNGKGDKEEQGGKH